MSRAPDTFHEFAIEPNLIDENGILTLNFFNPNDSALLFPLDDGMEVLYREGGFGLNFLRGLGIIFCWMALLAALGLASASFMSFPVAAFCSLGILALVFANGTMANAVSEGTIANYNAEKGTRGWTPADVVVIPTFRAVLKVIALAKDFSPIDSLSTGRSVTWGQLGLAFAQVVLLLGGSLALTFFVYVFINAGMVSGLLPVVGVPLPLVSYAGTSMVTLLAGFGILMALYSNRKLVGS
jgi:hypothetical protein